MSKKDILGRITETNLSTKQAEVDLFNARVVAFNESIVGLVNDIKNTNENINLKLIDYQDKIDLLSEEYKNIYNYYFDYIQEASINYIQNFYNFSADKTSIDYPDISDKVEGAKTIITNYINSIINESGLYKDLIPITLNYSKFKLFNDIGMTKQFSEIPFGIITNTCSESYRLSSNNAIKIKKDSNVKAVEFGFSIIQYNKFHFSDTEFDYINKRYIGDSDNPNVITRFYRGVLFFDNLLNDTDKTSVKAYIISPNNDINSENGETTVGPELSMNFYVDDGFCYILFNDFKPYRLDWREIGTEIDVFDMNNRNKFTDSFINFEIFGFVNDLTPHTNNNLICTNNDINVGITNGSITKISDEITLKPLKEGFVEYIGISPNCDDVSSNNDNLPLRHKIDGVSKSYFSHSITETINDITFNNIKENHVYDIYDAIMSTRDIYTETPEALVIHDILYSDGDMYIATNYGIYKKDNNLDEIINLTKDWGDTDLERSKQTYYSLGRDSEGNLVALHQYRGVITGTNEYFYESTDYVKSADNAYSSYTFIEAKYIRSINKFLVLATKGTEYYLLILDKNENLLLSLLLDKTKINSFFTDKKRKNIFIDSDCAYVITNSKFIIEYKFNGVVSYIDNTYIPTTMCVFKEFKYIFYKNATLYYARKLNKLNAVLETVSLSHLSTYLVDNEFDFFAHPTLPNSINYIGKKSGDTKITVILNTLFDNLKNSSVGFTNSNTISIELYTGIDTLRLNKFTYQSSIFYILDHDGSNFIYYMKGKLIKCISYVYSQTKYISDIKNDIRKLFKTEKSVRNDNRPIPYKLQIMAKIDDNLKESDEFEFSASMDEIGLFNDYDETLYDAYHTPKFLLLVNKNDRTVGYVASSKNHQFNIMDAQTNFNNVKNYSMNKIFIPGGFKRLPDEMWSFDNFFYIGMDGNLYGVGYLYDEFIPENEPKRIRNFTYPKLIKAIKGNIKKVWVFSPEVMFVLTDEKLYKLWYGGYNVLSNNTITENIDILHFSNNNIFFIYTNTKIRFLSNGVNYLKLNHEALNSELFYNINDASHFPAILSSGVKKIIYLNGGTNNYNFVILCENKKLYKFYFTPISGVLYREIVIPSITIRDIYRSSEEGDGKVYVLSTTNNLYLADEYSNTLITLDPANTSLKFKDVKTSLYTTLITDTNDQEWIKGFINGYFTNTKYINKFVQIPKNPKMSDIRIKDTYISDKRSIIVCEDSMYIINDDIYGTGDGTKNEKNIVKSINPDILPFLVIEIKNIKMTRNKTFILTKSGDLFATGLMTTGEFGLGLNSFEYLDFILINSDVDDFWVAEDRTVVLKNNKIFYCTGSNEDGRLGLGINVSSINTWQLLPSISENETIRDLFLKDSYTLALMNSGLVYSCGKNTFGQLGLGTKESQHIFKQSLINNCDKIFIDYKEETVAFIDIYDKVWMCGGNRYAFTGLTFDITNHELGYELTPKRIEGLEKVEYVIFGEKSCLYFCRDHIVGADKYGYAAISNNGIITKDNEYTLDFIKHGVSIYQDDIDIFLYNFYNSDIVKQKYRNNNVFNTYNENIGDDELVRVTPNQIKTIFKGIPSLLEAQYPWKINLLTKTSPNESVSYHNSTKDIIDCGCCLGNTQNYGELRVIPMYTGTSGFDKNKEVSSFQSIYDKNSESKPIYKIKEIREDISSVFNKVKFRKCRRLMEDLENTLDNRCKFYIKFDILPFTADTSYVTAKINGINNSLPSEIEIEIK